MEQTMSQTFTIHHTKVSQDRPFWYRLEAASDRGNAIRRAYQYALDNGGYICVKDHTHDPMGEVIFGTDPVCLQLAIRDGRNRDFLAA
jgi:hypothetical protein